MLIDMHLHTRRSKDSTLSFPDAVEAARKAGVDAICVTDHGRFTSEQEIAEMTERTGFLIFGGAEMNTALGHFLVYDVPGPVSWSLDRDLLLGRLKSLEREIQSAPSLPLSLLDSRLTRVMDLEAGHLVREVHAAGGAVIWAHPMDHWSSLRKWFNKFADEHGVTEMREFIRWLGENDATSWWPDLITQLDGIEVLNGSTKRRGVCNLLAQQLADHFGKPGTGGSDAHQCAAVARAVTRFDAEPSIGLKIGDLLRGANPGAVALQPVPAPGAR